MAIQNRRGSYSDFKPQKMVSGEWAVVLSGEPQSSRGRSVYMGFGSGEVERMATYEDMQENINTATSEIQTELRAGVESAISDINDEIAAAQSSVTSMQSAVNTSIQTMQSQVGESLDNINTRMDSMETDYAELKSDLEQQADDMQTAVETEINNSQNATASAVQATANANDAVSSIQENIDRALLAATRAENYANEAMGSAAVAQTSADNASSSADSALRSLSNVQDVVGVLDWAKEHGRYVLTDDTQVYPEKYYFVYEPEYFISEDTEVDAQKTYYERVYSPTDEYVLTSDTEVDSEKTYYTRSGSGTTEDPYVYTEVQNPTGSPVENEYYERVYEYIYEVVANPTGNPHEQNYYEGKYVYNVVENPTGNPSENGWYELDSVDEAVGGYVNSHLALTDEGLCVLKDNDGYKIVLSNDAMRVYDDADNLVGEYGDDVTIYNATSNRNLHIDDNSVKIRDGSDVLASFGEEAIIGKENQSQLVVNGNGIKGLNGQEEELYNINTNGAELVVSASEQFVYDSTYTINTGTAYPSNYKSYTALKLQDIEDNTTLILICRISVRKTSTSSTNFIDIRYECTYTGSGNGPERSYSVSGGVYVKCYFNQTNKRLYVRGYKTSSIYRASFFPKTCYYSKRITTPSFTFGTLAFNDDGNTMSTGAFSCIIGQNNGATGINSLAVNLNSIANGDNQTVIGKNNDPNETDLFIIGNGQYETRRSNALTVDVGGNIEIGIVEESAASVDGMLYDAITALSWESEVLD